MDGAELSPQELAYLLAVVHAPAVVGVDDPRLFPSDAKSQKAMFGKGRQQLEDNKWIEPISDHEDEYDLDPALVQMVAVIAGPEWIVATVRGEGDERRSVLHYLFGKRIVELWTTSDKSYMLGVVDDRDALAARLTEILEVPKKSASASFQLPTASFQKVLKFAENGKQDKAEGLLESAGEHAESFFTALGEPGGGQVFVVQPSGGQIESGRKATIVGGSWLVVRPEPDAEDLDISSLDAARLEQLLEDWME